MKKRTKVQNKTSVPKHIWGALIGAGVSTATSLIGANRAAKAAERERINTAKVNYTTQQASQLEGDRLELDAYPEDGRGNVNYYQAKGGKLAIPSAYKTRGGELQPVSSDMDIAKGNKHSESAIDNTTGIKLNNGKKDVAEIEDGETVKDNAMVYSDRSIAYGNKTHADVAKALSTEKGKLEKDLLTSDKITMATKRRKIQAIDQKENALFIKQEAEKGEDVSNALPKGAWGLDINDPYKRKDNYDEEVENQQQSAFMNTRDAVSKIPTTIIRPEQKLAYTPPTSNIVSKPNFADTGLGKGLTAAIPLIDNVANFIINKKTPKIPKPTLSKHRNLETEVNANPQLNAIQNAVDSSTRTITNNTSNSATARNAISSVRLKGAQQSGQVLAQKDAQEQALRNANVQSRAQINDINASKLDKFASDKLVRRDAMDQRTSANFANIAGDIVDARNFKATEAYNKERLDISRQLGDVNGTSLRADLNNPTEITKLLSNSTYAKERLEAAKNYPKELARLKAILGL